MAYRANRVTPSFALAPMRGASLNPYAQPSRSWLRYIDHALLAMAASGILMLMVQGYYR